VTSVENQIASHFSEHRPSAVKTKPGAFRSTRAPSGLEKIKPASGLDAWTGVLNTELYEFVIEPSRLDNQAGVTTMSDPVGNQIPQDIGEGGARVHGQSWSDLTFHIRSDDPSQRNDRLDDSVKFHFD
jgi:hypothetical protein